MYRGVLFAVRFAGFGGQVEDASASVKPGVEAHRRTVVVASCTRALPTNKRQSQSYRIYRVPKTKSNFGKRAFSVAAPRAWNELSISFKTSETIGTFLRKLETYLFHLVFPQ